MVALLRSLYRDLSAFGQRLRPPAPPKPGLYTYRFQPSGGQVRVHLRVESDGSGVLFVDVTDVVHLNPTATELAQWALEGTDPCRAKLRLQSRYGWSASREAQTDLDAIYNMVRRFVAPHEGCPTCALNSIERTPLFGTAIRAPYKADLAITYKCNNDCPHCYNESDRLALEAMSSRDWKCIVDRLCDVGVPHLIFTGGEATLYADLPEVIHHADQKGPLCGLNTNGRRMAHRSYADELYAAGLNHVQVTLGSHRAEVHNRMMNADCFAQTIRGIENAQAAGLHAITNTTLMQMNAEEIEETLDFLHALGIRTFAVNGMIYSGGGFDTGQAIHEQRMPPILVRIRDKADGLGMRLLWYTPTQYCRLSPVELEIGAKRCNAGEYSLCIEPNGDVLPCQSYYVAAGNLLRDPWDKIWDGALFRGFRDREDDPQAHGLPEMCWECPDLPLCGGGCRIEREALEGRRPSVEERAGSGDPRTAGGGCGAGGCGSSAAGFISLAEIESPAKRRGTGNFSD